MTICCPACSTATVDICERRTKVYRGIPYSYDRWNTTCPDCGLSVIPAMLFDLNRINYEAATSVIPHYISPGDILTIREIYEFSQEEAASFFQVSAATWDNFETFHAIPEPEMVDRMHAALASCDVMIDIIFASRPISA